MPVSMTSGGQVYYLAYDQVGSLKVVTDATGTVVKRIDYDSFGNILSDSNPSFNVPFGFGGGLHDRDIGLVRFGARDYDPATGKWTAKDPIDFAGGDLNLGSYVGQDPVNWVDPDGLNPYLDMLRSLWINTQYYFLVYGQYIPRALDYFGKASDGIDAVQYLYDDFQQGNAEKQAQISELERLFSLFYDIGQRDLNECGAASTCPGDWDKCKEKWFAYYDNSVLPYARDISRLR